MFVFKERSSQLEAQREAEAVSGKGLKGPGAMIVHGYKSVKVVHAWVKGTPEHFLLGEVPGQKTGEKCEAPTPGGDGGDGCTWT